MPISFSDIKRYNFNKAFLLRAAREVLDYLGWHVQQEIDSNSVTLISKVDIKVGINYSSNTKF